MANFTNGYTLPVTPPTNMVDQQVTVTALTAEGWTPQVCSPVYIIEKLAAWKDTRETGQLWPR